MCSRSGTGGASHSPAEMGRVKRELETGTAEETHAAAGLGATLLASGPRETAT